MASISTLGWRAVCFGVKNAFLFAQISRMNAGIILIRACFSLKNVPTLWENEWFDKGALAAEDVASALFELEWGSGGSGVVKLWSF